jgi:hypothetical protein
MTGVFRLRVVTAAGGEAGGATVHVTTAVWGGRGAGATAGSREDR